MKLVSSFQLAHIDANCYHYGHYIPHHHDIYSFPFPLSPGYFAAPCHPGSANAAHFRAEKCGKLWRTATYCEGEQLITALPVVLDSTAALNFAYYSGSHSISLYTDYCKALIGNTLNLRF